MSPAESLSGGLLVTIVSTLSLTLAVETLAAIPEDQLTVLKRELLVLALSVGPPLDKTPDAAPQSFTTLLATGDLQFALQFASEITNEQSRANALIAIAARAGSSRERGSARTLLSRVASASDTIAD